ncbi:MAG: DMT family transporter [Bacteroidetes bacterium]|nr:DMT family transporter [Bacteroidota bacterium]
MKSSRTGAYVSVILAMIFWGFTFVLFKIANESFRPVTISFLRLFISIFFLFGFALLFKRLGKIKRKDQKWFLLLALLEPFIYFLGEANGLTMVSATVGAVIISIIPLIVPFGAYYLFKEKLTRMNHIGLVISFGGVLMVILNKSSGEATDLKGVLLMFVAVLSAVGYTLVVKRLVDDYNPITITAYQSFYGLLMFIPLFLFRELPLIDWSAITKPSLLALLYLGVFGSGICFILIATGIRELGAARANIFVNLIPVVTAVVSFQMLKEPMPMIKIAGIGVAIAGLLMTQVTSINWKLPAIKGGFRHPPYS